MKSKSVLLILALFILISCGGDQSKRFSFTLPFYVLNQISSVSVNDTIWINTNHPDHETNYHSGDSEFIDAKYFDSEIFIYRLAESKENNINAQAANYLFNCIEKTGAVSVKESGLFVFCFSHIYKTYALNIGLIPQQQGVYAIFIKDKDEIRKIFGNKSFNRYLLNDFNIYELRSSTDNIAIDENVYFFEVEQN